MLDTIIAGVGILFGLAMGLHHALDRQARDAAWNRIASARRISQLTVRDLEERELALQVREDALDRRKQRLDQRNHVLSEREDLLEQRELAARGLPGRPSAPSSDDRDELPPLAQKP